MPITKIEFKPGIHKEGTQFAEGGNWYNCDKVRFRAGRPEKIGGWERANPTSLKGVCRVIMDLSLIHISEPTRRHHVSRMPSSA